MDIGTGGMSVWMALLVEQELSCLQKLSRIYEGLTLLFSSTLRIGSWMKRVLRDDVIDGKANSFFNF